MELNIRNIPYKEVLKNLTILLIGYLAGLITAKNYFGVI